MLKDSGCSGSDFKISNNILAGMAILPESLESISKLLDIEVSKSVAKTVSDPLFTSKRKFSKMGNTLLELITPLINDSCFSNAPVFTINFMLLV